MRTASTRSAGSVWVNLMVPPLRSTVPAGQEMPSWSLSALVHVVGEDEGVRAGAAGVGGLAGVAPRRKLKVGSPVPATVTLPLKARWKVMVSLRS